MGIMLSCSWRWPQGITGDAKGIVPTAVQVSGVWGLPNAATLMALQRKGVLFRLAVHGAVESLMGIRTNFLEKNAFQFKDWHI